MSVHGFVVWSGRKRIIIQIQPIFPRVTNDHGELESRGRRESWFVEKGGRFRIRFFSRLLFRILVKIIIV